MGLVLSCSRRLPCKLELEVDAEVLRACGVRRGCEERAVHLTVVVQREGEVLGDGIIGSETCLHHLVAACGLRGEGEDVALDGALVAERDVEAEVEGV